MPESFPFLRSCSKADLDKGQSVHQARGLAATGFGPSSVFSLPFPLDTRTFVLYSMDVILYLGLSI